MGHSWMGIPPCQIASKGISALHSSFEISPQNAIATDSVPYQDSINIENQCGTSSMFSLINYSKILFKISLEDYKTLLLRMDSFANGLT